MAFQSNARGYGGTHPTNISHLNAAPNNRWGVGADAISVRDNTVVLGKLGTTTTAATNVGIGTGVPAHGILHVVGSVNDYDYVDSKSNPIPGIVSVQSSSVSDLFTVSPTITTFKNNQVVVSYGATTVISLTSGTTTFSNILNVNPSGVQRVVIDSTGFQLIDTTTTGYSPSPFTHFSIGSFSVTLTGATSPITMTIGYQWTGNEVTLIIPTVTCTIGSGGATSLTSSSGVVSPTALLPLTRLTKLFSHNDSVFTISTFTIATNGTITLTPFSASSYPSGTLTWMKTSLKYYLN